MGVIVEAMGIPIRSVVAILSDKLNMKKLSARWVSHLLTIDDIRNRVSTSKECLAFFNLNPVHGRNMGSPQHSGDKAAVGFSW